MIDRYSKIYQNRTPSKERAQYKSDERENENENKENNASLKNQSYAQIYGFPFVTRCKVCHNKFSNT